MSSETALEVVQIGSLSVGLAFVLYLVIAALLSRKGERHIKTIDVFVGLAVLSDSLHLFAWWASVQLVDSTLGCQTAFIVDYVCGLLSPVIVACMAHCSTQS
ncbi:hypothetical protein KIPB_003282 [Kipferlia bialata]|uniref:Uncharacterized protein n=1 Tax=Kipferlia bialata TaxID=797122 RepID=A0A391NVB4_9EUKA|nr:hypothetical protein KIPB_003282 [Kipferlia bialata]|eukprot:g3282.t1